MTRTLIGEIVLTLAAAAFGGCARKVDDAAVTAQVKARLSNVFGPIEARQEKELKRGADQESISYISVTTVNGVVTLAGEVRGNRAKVRAGEIARSVPHVARVNNTLAVAPGYSDDAAGDK